MTENRKIELNIVTEADVKSYAAGTLTSDRCELIEEILLDDDRARRIVEQNARTDRLTPETSKELRRVMSAGAKSLLSYNLLSQTAAPQRVVEFAGSCISERKALLEKIADYLPPNGRAEAGLNGAHNGHEPSMQERVDDAADRDLALMSRLRAAFDTALSPIWKARIASWIARIENDLRRIASLSSTQAI